MNSNCPSYELFGKKIGEFGSCYACESSLYDSRDECKGNSLNYRQPTYAIRLSDACLRYGLYV